VVLSLVSLGGQGHNPSKDFLGSHVVLALEEYGSNGCLGRRGSIEEFPWMSDRGFTGRVI